MKSMVSLGVQKKLFRVSFDIFMPVSTGIFYHVMLFSNLFRSCVKIMCGMVVSAISTVDGLPINPHDKILFTSRYPRAAPLTSH